MNAPSPQIIAGMTRLADYLHAAPRDLDETIRDVLALLAEALDVRYTYCSRITGDTLRIARAFDRGTLGIDEGDTFALADTFCGTLHDTAASALVIENTAAHPRFAQLPITVRYHIGAYSGVPLKRADGSFYGTLCTLHPRPRRIPEGETTMLALAGRVIMQIVEAQEGADRLRALMEMAPIGAGIIDAHGIIEMANAAFCALMGYTAAELVGRHFSAFYPEAERAAVTAVYAARVQAADTGRREDVLWTKTGVPLSVQVDVMQITGVDGQPRRAWFVTDLTAQRQREATLVHDAHYDSLTGLANRKLFDLSLVHALTGAPAPTERDANMDTDTSAGAGADIGALLFLDLDGFKHINDLFGHEAGDRVLQAVAGRLLHEVRAYDLVARWGGDEFAVLLTRLPDTDTARRIADTLMRTLSAPISTGGMTVNVTVSIGIAHFHPHAAPPTVTAATVTAAADAAMYRAKRAAKAHPRGIGTGY